MAPQRSASAPLPPFARSSQKGARVVRFTSANTQNPQPYPHPSPRSLRLLPPPTPGGGFITMLTRSAKIPIPTPPPARFARCPPPLPVGAYITMLTAPSPSAPHNYFCYTINKSNTQPRPHPPPARARPPTPLRRLRGVTGRTARCPPRRPGGL